MQRRRHQWLRILAEFVWPLWPGDEPKSGWERESRVWFPFRSNPTTKTDLIQCVANGMPPYPQVQPILEFILDKKDGPMFTPHNTGSMNLMCGY